MLISEASSDLGSVSELPCSKPSWREAVTLSWTGQTVASLCWIISVFAYGISSAGDVLQLAAASAWLIANVAAVRESTS